MSIIDIIINIDIISISKYILFKNEMGCSLGESADSERGDWSKRPRLSAILVRVDFSYNLTYHQYDFLL